MADAPTLIRRAENLIEEINQVGVASIAEYEAIGDMTLHQLGAHLKLERETGRFQAMNAQHHAQMARNAAREGDLNAATDHLLHAQEQWGQALGQNLKPKKARRLGALPSKGGRPADPVRARLFDQALPISQEPGISIENAVVMAVAGDPDLQRWGRDKSPKALAASFRREREAREKNRYETPEPGY